jgi:dTDP-4-dehydrorhamnose 3,5-epimerase
MKIKKTTIKDCLKLELNQFKDFRGSFVKLFSENWFKKIKIKQINFCNFKKKNILRGFHYQIKPYQEIKIVFCIKGKCKIHILDLRKSSKTYKNNYSIKLNERKKMAILIPKGCPNAFQSLEKGTSLIYYSTNEYFPKYERQKNYKDKYIKIKFPKNLILSNKDQ